MLQQASHITYECEPQLDISTLLFHFWSFLRLLFCKNKISYVGNVCARVLRIGLVPIRKVRA